MKVYSFKGFGAARKLVMLLPLLFLSCRCYSVAAFGESGMELCPSWVVRLRQCPLKD